MPDDPQYVSDYPQTKEAVALRLTLEIAEIEQLSSDKKTYRKKLLDLYVECRRATAGKRTDD